MSKTLRPPSAKPAGRAGSSVKLFISYSHENRVWMKRLAPLLIGFQYDDRLLNAPGLQYLHAWHDKELAPGNPWDGEIRQELEEMDVFVPLVSFQFFSSRYIQDVELKRAKERFDDGEILVLPILIYEMKKLRQKCAFLHKFPVLPAPRRWWSRYPDWNDAHSLIDEGLWGAIDQALKRKAARRGIS
jgi:hypothetical protein